MLRHDVGCRVHQLGKIRNQHVDDASVELLARALEQRLVRRLLHERVLERVRRLRRLAALEDDLRADQPREPLAQARVFHPGDGGQQRVAELPPEHRRPLRHLLRRRQPVEPRHERPRQGRGDGVRPTCGPGLRHRLRQLLDVKRHPVGARHDRLGGQLVRQERRHHLPRLALREARELDRRQIRAGRPRCRELRARRRDEERAGRGALGDDAPEQLQR